MKISQHGLIGDSGRKEATPERGRLFIAGGKAAKMTPAALLAKLLDHLQDRGHRRIRLMQLDEVIAVLCSQMPAVG